MNPKPPALLVVNPAAHRVSLNREDPVIGALTRGFDLDVVETKSRGHATELASRAAEEGLGLLIALGGDGTANEAANGLARSATALAVLPGGEANILARALGMGRDPLQAARKLVARVDAEPRTIALGRIGERWFVSNCGVGLDAAIVEDVESHPWAKRRLGDLSFVRAGLRQFLSRYDRSTPNIELRWGSDLAEHRDGLFMAVAQNLSPYTYLGRRPMRLCPDADIDDALDVFAMDSFRLRHVLAVLLASFGRARHTRQRHVISLRDQRRLRIRCAVPLPMQADGEFLGMTTDVEVESVPAALRILS